MENLKQEAIKKAYGEHWEEVKNYIDDNGWIEGGTDRDFPEPKFEPSIGELEEHKTEYLWRPKSLQGIENNNGWIRIESEEQYDKLENGNYHWYNINTDRYCQGDLWVYGTFTHYRPRLIPKPKPPIY